MNSDYNVEDMTSEKLERMIVAGSVKHATAARKILKSMKWAKTSPEFDRMNEVIDRHFKVGRYAKKPAPEPTPEPEETEKPKARTEGAVLTAEMRVGNLHIVISISGTEKERLQALEVLKSMALALNGVTPAQQLPVPTNPLPYVHAAPMRPAPMHIHPQMQVPVQQRVPQHYTP